MRGSNMAWFLVCSFLGVAGAGAATYGWGLVGWAAMLCGALGCLWLSADGLWERHNEEIDCQTERIRARTRFAQTVATTDKETRFFLAQEWPELGVEFGQEHVAYVLKDGVNTQVLISFLRAFLLDSSENSFVDLRNYNDDKSLQAKFGVSREIVRTQWKLATEFLAAEGYLREGSMAGARTWQWQSKAHFQRMVRRYGNLRELGPLA